MDQPTREIIATIVIVFGIPIVLVVFGVMMLICQFLFRCFEKISNKIDKW